MSLITRRSLIWSAAGTAAFLAAKEAQAQFNGCPAGFCPSGFIGGGGSLPQVTGFSNFTGSNLSQYFAGLAARSAGTRNVPMMAYGDSTVSGFGANGAGFTGALPKAWPTVLAGLVANSGKSNRIGDGNASASGIGINAYDSRVTVSGGFAAVLSTTASILGGAIYQSSTAGALYTFNPGVVVDTFVVGMAVSSATGLLQASLDGGTTPYGSTFGGSAAAPFAALYTTISVPRGMQVLTLKSVPGASQNIMSVVAFDSTAKEISIMNAGYGAATSAILSTTASFPGIQPITLLTGAGNFRPDLVIAENGIINDWNGTGGATLGSTLTNNQTIINAVKGYGGSIILMSGAPSNPAAGNASYVVQKSFVDQMKALAYSNNIPFIDVWTLFGGTYQASLMSDGIHPNQTGYAQIAGYANTAMNPAFRAA